MRLRVRLNPTKIKAKFKQVVNISGAWGTITGTITDQTDLVSYVTSRLVGYATEAWVNAQGFVTNVITALGYTPENVANKENVLLDTSTTKYPTNNLVKTYVDTGLSGKEDTITTLSISKGGTNSGNALANNRIMQSSGGAIVEAPAINANRALVSDANGIPVASSVTATTLGFLDATSSVQTQLNDGKPYLIDFTKTTSTGSAFSTKIVRSYLIPANTFKTGDVVKITCKFSRPASQSGNTQYFIRYSTDNVTYSALAVFSAMSATQKYQRGYRHLDIVNAVNTTQAISSGAQVLVDDTTVANTFGVFSINWTQDLYIGIALTQSITTDSSTIESVIIEKIRI